MWGNKKKSEFFTLLHEHVRKWGGGGQPPVRNLMGFFLLKGEIDAECSEFQVRGLFQKRLSCILDES